MTLTKTVRLFFLLFVLLFRYFANKINKKKRNEKKTATRNVRRSVISNVCAGCVRVCVCEWLCSWLCERACVCLCIDATELGPDRALRARSHRDIGHILARIRKSVVCEREYIRITNYSVRHSVSFLFRALSLSLVFFVFILFDFIFACRAIRSLFPSTVRIQIHMHSKYAKSTVTLRTLCTSPVHRLRFE